MVNQIEQTDKIVNRHDEPWQLFTCQTCDGKGYTAHRITVYEHGCGFPHDDTEERQCPECSGYGEFIGPCEGDAVPARPRWRAAIKDN